MRGMRVHPWTSNLIPGQSQDVFGQGLETAFVHSRLMPYNHQMGTRMARERVRELLRRGRAASRTLCSWRPSCVRLAYVFLLGHTPT